MQHQLADETEGKSKYSEYVSPDGRRWDQLTVDEKAKVRKKLKKKNQIQILNEKKIDMVSSLKQTPEEISIPDTKDPDSSKISVED